MTSTIFKQLMAKLEYLIAPEIFDKRGRKSNLPTEDHVRILTILYETLSTVLEVQKPRQSVEKHPLPTEGICNCTHPGIASCGKKKFVISTEFGNLCAECLWSYKHNLSRALDYLESYKTVVSQPRLNGGE